MKQSFRTRVRQWWTPAEFRLPEPEFTREQLDLLEELIQLIVPNISRAANVTRDGRTQMASFLVDLGTGIWRVRRKIEGISRMPREIRDALFSLESMWMSMSDGGVEIVDHIGTIPSAREAKIVETREMQGLVREQVIDAVKPTILLRGDVIQLGEVVMGKPAASEPAIVPEQEEIHTPPVEVETLTIEPPLNRWEPEEAPEPADAAPTEPQMPAETEMADETAPQVAADTDAPEVTEASVVGVVPPHEDDEPRLDSETAMAMEAMESSGEIEIPLPPKARRKSKSVREALKQVIREEPEISALDDTGRAKRRKMRSAVAKQAEPEPEAAPRRKRKSKKSGEEGT